MKKITCLLLISAYLLNGCHSNTPSVNSNTNNSSNTTSTSAIDTPKAHVISSQPPADTGIKDGPLITRYANGVMKERSYYVAGRRQGECQSFYPNGKLWSDDFFAAGLLNGATTSYYDNGQKRYEGVCSKGKPVGTWKYYDNTGKLLRTIDYNKTQSRPVM